jgi:hypothetical protein
MLLRPVLDAAFGTIPSTVREIGLVICCDCSLTSLPESKIGSSAWSFYRAMPHSTR